MGAGAPAAQHKTDGEALTLSSVLPTREGFTFTGWAKSALASQADYQPGDSYTEDAGLSLYAVWRINVQEGSGAVSMQSGVAPAGGNTTLTVSISGNPGIAGYRFYIYADTDVFSVGLTDGLLNIAQGDFSTGGSLLTNTVPGGWQILWYSTVNASADGSLFTIELEISDDAAAGAYPITLAYSAQDTVNTSYEPVPLSVSGTTLTVTDIIRGDVNGDTFVNNADVIRLARSMVGLETLSENQRLAADVNGDGYVNNADVIKLARSMVGLDSLS